MTRIIAGAARGRRLEVPAEGTRPTSDRAREGLFSSLEARFGLEGRVVLDLFAGSGALGLEALSRGAETAVLVDSDRKACATMRTNARNLGLAAEVVQAEALGYLSGAPRRQFEVVLADPPYAVTDAEVAAVVAALEPVLADAAVVAVERPASGPETAWPAGFEPTTQKLKKRTYGVARFDVAFFDRRRRD